MAKHKRKYRRSNNYWAKLTLLVSLLAIFMGVLFGLIHLIESKASQGALISLGQQVGMQGGEVKREVMV